jgi:hypothetical protein
MSISLFKELLEKPPSLMQSSNLSFKFFPLFYISLLSSSTITLLTALSMSPHSNSLFNSKPTFHTWFTYLVFILCSPKHGLHIIGIPLQMLSNIEFHPQWLKKPPIALCARTSFWVAHFTM